MVAALSRGGVAIGDDGLIVEVHPAPEKAISDGAQSLDIPQFQKMMKDLEPYIRLWRGSRAVEAALGAVFEFKLVCGFAVGTTPPLLIFTGAGSHPRSLGGHNPLGDDRCLIRQRLDVKVEEECWCFGLHDAQNRCRDLSHFKVADDSATN